MNLKEKEENKINKFDKDNTDINYNDIKCAIEAILFMSPRSISLSKIIKNIPNIDKTIIELELFELINEYNKKNTALKIIFDNNKVEMILKPEYLKYSSFAVSTKLNKAELKTLGLISLNSPVEQSKITKIRSYNHLTKLKELDLIKVTKKGHKNILSTTNKFNILYNKKHKF
jgi:segregation and condensation protein B